MLSFASIWENNTICEAVTSASASLCQVGQEFRERFFTEITYFIPAEHAPFADQEQHLPGAA